MGKGNMRDRAYEAGRTAARRGLGPETCNRDPQTVFYEDWHRGFNDWHSGNEPPILVSDNRPFAHMLELEQPTTRIIRRGLSKKIGNTGISISTGAHYPWTHWLMLDDKGIAAIDLDGFRAVKRLIKTVTSK